MYDKHQSKIQAFARANPDNLARTLWLAILSANTSLTQVGSIIDDMEAGRQSTTGARIDACSYAWDNRHDIYALCEEIYYHGHGWQDTSDTMLNYLASLPGLDTVKAGFACQLTYGLSGCLDTHNIRRFGLSANVFRNFKQRKTVRGRHNLVHSYNKLVARLGGTRTLWDTWCQYVAKRNPVRYKTAYAASKLHCDILNLTGV